MYFSSRRRSYLSIIAIALFFLSVVPLMGQTDSLPAFPSDFTGNWAGNLEIYQPEGVVQTVPMQLRIQPLGDTAYTYTIIYGEDEAAGTRPYILVPGTDGPHHWVCDEKNSILLDGYYFGNIYQSVFTVQGSYLISALEHRDDHLVYTIHSGKATPVRNTGATERDETEIPSVDSYMVGGFQRALLRRR